jgi:hypothetical protein
MSSKTAVLAVGCVALLAGCGGDSREENAETVSNLIEAGFPAEDIQVAGGDVYVGNDAHVSLQASREMLQAGEGTAEHYRTSNIVNTSTVRRVCLNPSASFRTYSKLMQGLDMAIANFNAVGLCFTMVQGASGCDATITMETATGSGGQSGFPSGGRPYGQVLIGTGLNGSSVSLDLVEHIITHELGHAFGFRHSDFFNQAHSCGYREPSGVGGIHIPGTPTTSPAGTSLMNACTPANPTGEFTSTDITALRVLYGSGC